MATKTTKKVKKSAPKKTVKKVEKKVTPTKASKVTSFYNKEVSFLLAIAIEVLLLILGYVIIMVNV